MMSVELDYKNRGRQGSLNLPNGHLLVSYRLWNSSVKLRPFFASTLPPDDSADITPCSLTSSPILPPVPLSTLSPLTSPLTLLADVVSHLSLNVIPCFTNVNPHSPADVTLPAYPPQACLARLPSAPSRASRGSRSGPHSRQRPTDSASGSAATRPCRASSSRRWTTRTGGR